ncbi:hypothetical protein [Achromobacter xylosoxidans]|uniref:hypothetical protein n=1 Tax=Alcaligenes xylosoxydans xylosoxydans TaxID=85698 RepID=UPI001EEEBF83|nr:hypothetical protein [Achromobacter xylosoxidans]
MKDLWVLEWSHEASMFHVQELKHSIDGWRRHFAANTAPNDWVPIFVGTEQEVDAEAERLEQIMVARAQVRREQDGA